MSTIQVPADFNFAAAVGIHSLAGAIVFTVLYVPLLGFFFVKSFTHPTYVHYVLTFFCLSKQKYHIFPQSPLPELNMVDCR